MGSFLDKVGLQHVVEKVKGLLSGYLPLSGGDMTGDIVYTDKATLNGTGLKFGKDTNLVQTSFSLDGVTIKTKKVGTLLKPIEVKVSTDGFIFIKKNGDEIVDQANLSISDCTTKKFILTKKDKTNNGDIIEQDGLIANNSETVVKEVDDLKAINIYYADSISSDDEGYLGVNALSVIYQMIEVNTSLLQILTIKDTDVSPYFQSIIGSSEIKIPISANTSCCLRNDLWILNDPESIKAIVVKGVLIYDLTGFSNLETFRSNGSYIKDLNIFRAFFENCTKLTYVDVNDWNIDMATNLIGMFHNCSALSNITLNLWDTRNVTDTSNMFAQCSSLESLDLTGWNMMNATNMADMFAGCSKIKNLLLSEGFGRMKDEVGTLDLSSLTLWTTTKSVQTLLTLYDRKANGMGVITIKLSAATKSALGTSGIQAMTAKGYTIA